METEVKKSYVVIFKDSDKFRDILVEAFSEDEAKILAQAQRIKSGVRYDVYKVVEV